MYIKRIIIQGFKTYKNRTVIDLLSPHHNVVVGRNGSGKSNFFAAIRFVLSDAYTHMNREERQGLIHEGSGTVMSAYVEIIFDNIDGRFPINKPEISIRRTIGLKKDDYSLDGKSATRSDIMNLLESAGFSRSNPYYIVPQGRITSLTNSKDHERLALLKEVSGATVFENKLKESMKEMNQSDLKKSRIDETLESIASRLSDLQIESDDLKDFQTFEKQKKILEYNIFRREDDELVAAIEDLEFQYAHLVENSQNDINRLQTREKLCVQLEDNIKDLKTSLKVTAMEKEQTDLDLNQLLQAIADKQIKLNELRNSGEVSSEKQDVIKGQIERFESLIRQHESKISKSRPRLLKLQEQESQLKQKLLEATSKQRAIYAKQTRFSQFKTKKNRDSWLSKEISNLKKAIQEKDQDIHQITNDLKARQHTLEDLSDQIETLNQKLNDETYIQSVAELKTKIAEHKSQITNLTDERKILWRDEIRLKSVFDSITNDLNNATDLVNQTMDRAQAQGIAAVKTIVEKLNLGNKVFGTVAELFNVNDKYKTAAEVIAGNSLFHIVVDTDATAALIMEELHRTKGGRVTFMPLNRISVNDIEYPDANEFQCIPLISRLRHDENVSKAIKQVFGKAIVVSELSRGSELARRFNLNAITLDGDRVDTKGVLSGGYRDYKNSRIDALKIQTKKRKELKKTEEDLIKTRNEIEGINQKLTSLNNELQLNVRDLDKKNSEREPIKIQLSQITNKKFHLEQELSSLKYNLETLNTSKNSLSINLKQHEQELDSGFTQVLSQEELQSLENLTSEISEIEGKLDKVVTEAAELESTIAEIESELTNSYQPKLAKLQQDQLQLGSRSMHDLETNELEQEVEHLQIQLDTAQSRNQDATDKFNQLNDEIQRSEAELQKSNEQQILLMKKLEKSSKDTNKVLSAKALKVNQREAVGKKMAELGALPEEAFRAEKYDRFKTSELIQQLNEANEELSKYSHINKKAMEQYNTFTKQRDELVSRRTELETSREAIESLIRNLQQQKDDAIKKSFKQVSKAFHEIFEKLVPQGVGNLIMQRKDEDQSQAGDRDESASESEIQESIENYTGVSISVSFNSRHDEQQRIEQLSGGQKSLCAIALIFAIQNCDPAPFYLFDEIDANLDTQYRTAVASLIKSLASNAQFICTTFRPEMLQVADKFYGVMFSNKVSTVSEINKDEAMSFVEGQQHR
ncbi:SMC3 [[Candida] subhashii]|uniref:Structural maintenance of chromosomes protein n=1 Tax=[Candida] subhashii TaxID=561895 RepID=A0A8J5QJN2_9ASCO|nr:SMC3 [[Candida] subhashii]KAG7663234.1 SMC3 [[Candida] subhashii]